MSVELSKGLEAKLLAWYKRNIKNKTKDKKTAKDFKVFLEKG